jgi:TolB-like protein/AraC-like DNA-binding protein/tetratricopeptide (TPR) repeat protein
VADELLDKIKKIIEANLDNPSFSIEILCQEVQLSRSQLHRKIKQLAGLSTSLYIRKIRLDRAADLLLEDKYNISEVSYLTGIDSPQNFSKYFAEQFGVSPSQYRKNILEEKMTFEGATSAATSSSSTVQSSYVSPYLAYLILIGSIVLGLYFIVTSSRSSMNEVPLDSLTEHAGLDNSIAVLPFVNFGPADKEYLVNGIVEDILTSLSYFKDLKVISRTSSMTLKDTKKTIPEIGRELNVSYLLEGSVQNIGDEFRITAQLIRAADDAHIWAKRYTRHATDVFAMQSEISLDIAETLNQQLTAEVSEMIVKSSSNNFTAYNEYLIGRSLLMTRTEEGIRNSILRFDQALISEPTFVRALASKASAYQLLANSRYGDPQANNQRAEDLALQAIKLDAANGLAYATLGSLYKDQYRWKEAERAFEVALKYSPNDALTNYWYSLLLREMGDLETAVKFSGKALELDPLHSVIYGGHIVNCTYLGDEEMSERAIREGKELFDDSFIYHWAVAKYKEYHHDYQGALLEYGSVLQLNPQIPAVENGKIFCQGRLGHESVVRDFISNLTENTAEQHIARAIAFAGLNDVTNSLSCLLAAADSGAIPTDIKVDPKFDVLRQEPDFEGLLTEFSLAR